MVTVLLDVIVSPCDSWDCSNSLVVIWKRSHNIKNSRENISFRAQAKN